MHPLFPSISCINVIFSHASLSFHQVIWHQALLAFAQRYKFEFDEQQRDRLRQLVKIQQHHQITAEVKRELIAALASSKKNAGDDSMSVSNSK
jgi:essential nuclear protein 1